MEKEEFVKNYQVLQSLILDSVRNGTSFSMQGYDADELKGVAREIATEILAGNFDVLYQPQVNFDGQVKSAEAYLGQYLHGVDVDRRVIAFIARTNNFEEKLSKLFLEKICLDLQGITKALGGDYMVMFTMNPQYFNDEFCKYYCETLIQNKLKPENVGIEFLESSSFDGVTVELMEKLKSLGTKFILDGYGMASTQGELLKYPFDYVKISEDITENINLSDEHQQVVEDLMRSYHRNFKIVADGVKTKEEYETLQNLSFRMIQGYVFSNIFSKEELIEKSSTVSKGFAQ